MPRKKGSAPTPEQKARYKAAKQLVIAQWTPEQHAAHLAKRRIYSKSLTGEQLERKRALNKRSQKRCRANNPAPFNARARRAYRSRSPEKIADDKQKQQLARESWTPEQREYHRKWRDRLSPEKKLELRHQRRLWTVRTNYGLTAEQYTELMQSQSGVCAICRTATVKSLAVDHDHITGIVRGLLCSSCNNGLGRFKDSPENLQRAADYLVRTRPTASASTSADST
jgi:hypothetical protein